ncbi:hypothetical protein [Candidatus Finniella inopinata]|uniref:hypothetical protein n=1 Tax=Candidatus Finniella inopinata TaxID=1696036 RepID=UPI0013EE8688|nr:hypothetical protein [Candidatus Finniella inopinata]
MFSTTYAGSVELGFVENQSIHDALKVAKAAGDRTPSLTLSTDTQTEEKSSDLSSFTSLTILGQKPDGTVIRPVNTSDVLGRRAFSILSSLTFSTLALSHIKLRGFIINSESDADFNSPSLTVSIDGPVTFRENEGYLCGAIHSKSPLSLSGIGPATFTQNKASLGGAIYSGGSLTISCPADFNWNSAKQVGGAIRAESVTFSGNHPVSFTRNNSINNHGGAIYAESIDFSGTRFVTFTGNMSISGNGGAICANALILKDAQFSENKATKGGAVFICGGSLIYTTSSLTRLNPTELPPVIGDNDLACESLLNLVSIFTKNGPSSLVLNTNNSEWNGHTVIQEGHFIVGDTIDCDGAVWGANGANTITIKGDARMGGFGTINANKVTFENGSVWCLFFGGDKVGKLNVQGAFTLPTGIDVKETKEETFPTDGVIVATYGTLAGDLNFLNMQLIDANLILESQVIDSQSKRLVLKQFCVPPTTTINS